MKSTKKYDIIKIEKDLYLSEKGDGVMKMKWEDVYDIFESAALWENGHDMYWYRLMWALMEYKKMNVFQNEADRIKVISRAFAIIRIYTDFIGKCFDDEDYEEISEIYSDGVFNFLFDSTDVHEIFSVLSEELGTKRTFYSMFITCVEFRNGRISYIEYDDESDDEDYDDDDDCYTDDYEDDDDDELFEDEDSVDDDDEEDNVFENCSEDYYYSFESYINVLAKSSMSLLNDFTPEKAAGYIYLAKNMLPAKNKIN